ncbi:MupA/Atu3671 family FMN-dependent luciferase-like monooxygenase [Streptomyces sp. NPDC059717]|uniref:MupA/Atu3671 family FMN-dependent luciferase-like monooxygenase n=1 Tax=Streptomyces sp. NPDC059717 TaxID=3346922 RepID=UPI0036CB106A
MECSIMFFGADPVAQETEHATKYEDIVAVTRAAEELGFAAVWTPERHFQQVGQVFPNPALLSAALAMVTERIALRGGSVVLPLHHPLRVVEDWSVVDNLSHGRAGFSVATGWHSTDFVLAPDHYDDRRERALRDIPLLRRLWSGESGEFADGTGRMVAVRPQPLPVQAELPLWLSASGSLATWETAGRLRTGVLGATVGQNMPGLVERIARYRAAYRTAESPPAVGPHGDHGTVTLMAHTYVGTDDAEARHTAEAPLKAYLSSHMRQMQSNRDEGAPTPLDERQVDQLTDFAFHRYLSWGSLIGSPDTCAARLSELRDLGCDEVACFVDFGLGQDRVLAGLHRLAALRKDLA